MLSALLVVCGMAVQDPTPAVRLTNPAPQRREEVVRFSMPWPRGRFAELSQVRVGDDLAPCITLERWPDGSVAVSQVHARVALGPSADVRLPVVPLGAGEARLEPAGQFRFDGVLPVRTELEDPWGRTFVARLDPDPAGEVQSWASSARIRVRRLRGVHTRRGDDGAVEVFLPVAAWLVEYADSPRAELTVVLDNDPRAGEVVVGAVRFRSFALRVDDSRVAALPRFRNALLLRPVESLSEGRRRLWLLGPGDALYLGDRTRKAFRVDLIGDAEPMDAAVRAAAQLAVDAPIVALPDLAWVRSTRAFGAHGGPGPLGGSEAQALARRRGPGWSGLQGGPFGVFGDLRDARGAGLLRCGPAVLHDLLRVRDSGGSIVLAELRALQQTLRPTPAATPREPAETEALRQGLSPRAVARPHGYTAVSYESFSVDLLHDWFWLSGDPLARHEIARAGSGLLPILRTVEFRTSRGEGLALQAGVRIARATGDRGLIDALLQRFHEVLAIDLGDEESARAHAIAQPPHLDALGPDHPFDAPDQMALLVQGLVALWQQTGDEEVRRAAVRVARRIAGACWIEGEGPCRFVSARDPRVRIGSPDVAELSLIASALVLAAEVAESDHALLRERAGLLGRRIDEAGEVGPVAGRWMQVYRDRMSQGR